MNAPPRVSLFGRIARKLRDLSAQRSTDPLAAALNHARRIAFVGRSRADAKGVSWIAAAEQRGASIDNLPLMQPYRRDDGRVMSFLGEPQETYDCVVIHHRLTLYEHSWSYAFLDRLNAMLAEDGVVLVPAGADQIPRARLEQLFGAAPVHAGAHYFTFAKARGGLRRPHEAPVSTLDAYWALRDALVNETFDPRLGSVMLELGADRVGPPPHMDRPDPMVQMQSQSYRTSSARTKSALVEYILSLYFPDRRDLHVADLGAGTALNSFELLLNPSGVGTVTMVEINRDYHWAIAAVYDWLGERVRGKVRLATSPVQDYRGQPVDAAFISGVLSIVGPVLREPFVVSAWENLAPGGILIVLENMQQDDRSKTIRYNQQRCTPEELDALLGRYASIRYFNGQAMQEIRIKDAGNATVFRVIQKPG